MWFKKKQKLPIEPIVDENTIKVDETAINIMARISEIHMLHPDMQYIFWFERMLHPVHIQTLRDSFEKHSLKGMVIQGCAIPAIFEFKQEPTNDYTTGQVNV